MKFRAVRIANLRKYVAVAMPDVVGEARRVAGQPVAVFLRSGCLHVVAGGR
jgi:hypothetical protein